MHSSRTVIRAPHACRIVRAPLATSNRTISLLSPFAAPSPRLAGFPSHDFAFAAAAAAPLFRLLDDFALAAAQPLRAADVLHQHSALTAAVAAPRPTARSPAVAFASAPRFDVRELEGAYELRGELPGVEPRDLEVEFADAQTLVVRGRVETLTESGGGGGAVASATTMAEQQQQHSAAATAAETTADSDAASVHSSTAASYHRATVEDEAGTLSETSLSTPGEATPAGSNDGGSAEDTQAHAQVQTVAAAPAQQQQQQQQQQLQQQQQQQPQQQQQQSKTWFSQRSLGSFQRTFSFPARVDHDNVRASLRNGVLSIVVPKAAEPAALRRINIT